MPRTFEEAKELVLKDLAERVPDNGMEAQWIRAQISAVKSMTEESMHEALEPPTIENPATTGWDERRSAAESIQAKMTPATTAAGRGKRGGRATRGRRTRNRRVNRKKTRRT